MFNFKYAALLTLTLTPGCARAADSPKAVGSAGTADSAKAANTTKAAGNTIELRDYTGRGFAPDIVNYRVPAAGADKLRITSADGTPLATQVTPGADKKWATLSFVTDLPANGARSLVVQSSGARAVTQVSARPTPDGLELANGLFTIRVPAVTQQSFKSPVPASSLPAPLLGFRKTPSGTWCGTGKVLASRLVKSMRVSLTARGPVFAEATYELQFAAGGFYRATLRIEDNVPVAKISEEYDPGVMDGTDSWEFNLAAGWNADRMEVATTAGNGGVDHGHVDPLEKLKTKPSWFLVPDSAWGAPLSQLGLFNDAAQKADGNNYPMAGVVPLHKGDWRNMNALEVQSTNSTDVRVRFPMSRRNASWLREVTSETSPFSMQEHEPGQSLTYGRRHWGLVLGKPAATTGGEGGGPLGPFYQARLFYGVVGLDAYKDFVLDWPDTGVKYPRVYLKAAEAARYKEQLQTSTLPEEFKKKLLEGTIALGATEPAAAAKLKATLGRLSYIALAPMVSPTTGHHWTAPQYTTAAGTDDVLGWPGLSAEARRDIRARVALICYLWENADVISYANGSHSGNPNMGTARFSPMVSFLPLVPDHPMFAQWRTHMAQYLEYKATSQMAPGGGYFEYGAAYHMHGYSRVMNVLPALKAAQAPVSDHMLDADLQDWRYYLNLLTPVDSRWKYRVFPGLANSGPGYTENLAEAAGEVAGRDPELAANLLWAWLANGANDRSDPLTAQNGILVPAGLQPKEPALTSAIFPGVGVIFRAHQGPDETYMFLRSGNNWSHWNEDQGHMIVMSRGATLLPFQPYQYWGVKDKNFEDKNLLRFGAPENKMPHAWPDSNILDHAFGPSVDYAWSSTGFPDWYISPGSTTEFSGKVDAPVGTGAVRPLADVPGQKQGAFTWDRQVLFLKGAGASSPNYFAVRDSTSGEGQLANWFNLNLLGPKSNVKIEEKNLLIDTEWPVKLDLRFAGSQSLKPDLYEELQFVSLGGYSGPSWWRKDGDLSPNWVKQDGSPQPADIGGNTSPNFWEKHTMVRLQGAPGSGYLWVIYPRKADEPAPVVSTPAPGVLKVEHPEGVDYAFLSAAPMRYDADGVLFEGCAGAVRVARDGKVTLVLSSGSGRVGYKGIIISGASPLEKSFIPGQAAPAPPALAFATALPAMLTGHAPLVPGVMQAKSNGTTEYLVQATSAAERVQAAQTDFHFEASRARIYTDGKTVRFVVPDANYARLSLGNVGVRGLGPFDLTFAADKISGKVDGATRTLVTTFPPAIVRPMYRMDGNRWYAGWADDHSIVKGTLAPQFGIGFGVTKGQHTVEIGEWTYPGLPPAVERRVLGR